MTTLRSAFVLLVGALLWSPETAGATEPHPGEFELFEGGTFTPHSASYDSLTLHLSALLNSLSQGPDEIRWQKRFSVLAMAYALGTDEMDRAWLKRAAELAIWQAAQTRRRVSPDVKSGWWEEFMRPEEAPQCLDPVEVADLLTLDRALRSAEDEVASHPGGGP